MTVYVEMKLVHMDTYKKLRHRPKVCDLKHLDGWRGHECDDKLSDYSQALVLYYLF